MSNPTVVGVAAARVDSHAHVFLQSLPRVEDARYIPTADAPLSSYLQLLDLAGLTHGVLVQPSFLGTDNSFLLSRLQAARGRLKGVAVVDPGESVATLRSMANAGIVGIRLNLIGQSLETLNIEPWELILDFVKRHRWHVEVHAQAAELPKVLAPLLDAGVRVVVDHFGRPDAQLGTNDAGFDYLLSTAATRQVWVKLSASYRWSAQNAKAEKAAADQLLSAFGAERLVWGSDWPYTMHEHEISYEQTLSALEAWVPDESARHQILGATATELFHIDKRPDMNR